jgi:hypothetical protein
MGFIRKVGKKIAGGIRKLGRKLKKGLGKVARAFGKLGPLGSLALSFILPGIGSAIGGWISNNTFLGPIFETIKGAASWVKEGVGTVFNKVTDAIEYGMNVVSKPFMQEGARGAGSAFRDFVSDATGGFIEKSTVGVKEAALEKGLDPEAVLQAIDEGLTTADEIRKEAFGKKYPELFKDSKVVDVAKDKTLKETIKESETYQTYKKVEPFRKFGQAINEQEEAVANYNANILARKRDYFSDFGQDILGAGGGQTISTPMNFINVADIFSSDDVAKNYNRAIYGDLMPDDSFVNHNALAMGAINYGTSIYDIMGRD